MNKQRTITKKEIESFIIGFCMYAGIDKKINIKQAHEITNYLYNIMGLCVTTLFVEKVWNKHITGGTDNE